MSPRLAVVVGLVSGMLVAGLMLGGLYALAPEAALVVPTLPPSPTPSEVASASPARTPAASASPLASASPSASAGLSGLFHIGEPAPPLVVAQVGGGTFDLKNLRGKPVWINFMATYCPPCRDEFPLMNGFLARYAPNDLVVVAIDVKEDEGTVAGFAESLGATFPLGLDPSGANAQEWGALVLPVHFWIDAKGIVRDGALGGIGPDIMARGLQTILPDVTVTP